MATQAVDDTKGIHWLKSGKTPGSTSPSDYDTVRVIDGVLFINSRPVANYNNGGILWSGAVYPTSTQPVTPTKPINQCANGWCLVWSDYAPGVGPNDWDWCYSYIPKGTPGLTQGHIFAVPSTISASGTVVTVKALTISSTGIQGDDNNGNSNASENDVCLRYVLEY
jgi:hypothetical protein